MTIKWLIHWRGKITRNIDCDTELADTASDAKELFEARYPMREILTIVLKK